MAATACLRDRDPSDILEVQGLQRLHMVTSCWALRVSREDFPPGFCSVLASAYRSKLAQALTGVFVGIVQHTR